MSLTKRTYTDGETVITAQNLNDIQDEVRGNLRNVSFNTTSGKFQKTTNSGTTSDIVTLDASPTSGSKKPVQSGGVYETINTVQSGLLSQLAIAIQRIVKLESFDDEAAYLGKDENIVTIIEDDTDYNTLKTEGTYLVVDSDHAGTMTNAPAKVAHRMYVFATSTATNRICQLVFCNGTTNVYIYARMCAASTWSPWKALTPIPLTHTVSAGSGTRTFNHSYIPSGGVVTQVHFSDPKLVGSDVVFETSAGSITITGTFYGSVTISYFVQ